jgi:hypothetical protein
VLARSRCRIERTGAEPGKRLVKEEKMLVFASPSAAPDLPPLRLMFV